jgi:outer membrane murein-binding lipoprotein Lpp
MTDGAIHQMSAAIGGLQADVRSLKDSIENLNKIWGQREEAATNGRRAVHEKVDTLSKEVTLLSAEVENVSKDLVEIKPAIDAFKTARDRQDGAQKLGKRIWVAFIGLAGIAGGAIVEMLHQRH